MFLNRDSIPRIIRTSEYARPARDFHRVKTGRFCAELTHGALTRADERECGDYESENMVFRIPNVMEKRDANDARGTMRANSRSLR